MSFIDGSPEPLSYGEALCAIAERTSFGDEAQGREVLRAVQREHGLLPPDPVVPLTAEQEKILAQEKQLAELQAQMAAMQASQAAPVPAPTPVVETPAAVQTAASTPA